MALSLDKQFQTAIGALTDGDVQLLSTLLTDPSSVTLDEQRTQAQKLGLKRGFLSAAVNTFSDPTIWLAFLMSRRFPVRHWMRGTIPNRFIGAANEFSGISLLTRPVEGFFRGTNVPKLTALAVQREMEVMKVGTKIFRLIESRPNWKEEMKQVSMLLEGVPSSGAGPELHRVAQQVRSHMTELWGFLNKTRKIEGGFKGSEVEFARSRPFTPVEAPRFLRDYLPHIPLTTNETMIEMSGREALRRLARGPTGQAFGLKGENVAEVWQPDAADRLGSNFARYQTFMNNVGAEVINPRLFRRQRIHEKLSDATGQDLFVTDLNILLQRYVHSVSKTYAVGAPLSNHERLIASTLVENAAGAPTTIMPTAEPIIVQVINEGLRASGGRLRRSQIAGTNVIRETLVPGSFNTPTLVGLRTLVRNLQGLSSEDEILWGNMFSGVRNKLSNTVGRLTNRRREAEIDSAIGAIERTASYRNKSNSIASFFYSTTLGLNPWSAIQNMLQPILTTAPAIGIGNTLAGYRVLANRIPRYAKEVARQRRLLAGTQARGIHRLNESMERAFNEVFPELTKQGIRADPRLFDIDVQALEQRGILRGGRFAKADDYFKLLLQPFTHSELSNQIVTFYGAKSGITKALKVGEMRAPPGLGAGSINDWLNFEAGSVVNSTQFRPGPGSRTVFQSLLPAPFRQFTSFPVRLGNFFADSTVRGALSARQVTDMSFLDKVLTLGTGRNLGTIARTYIYGKMVTNGLRETLGVDVGGSLGITTPFANIAPSNQPFAPFPLPPLPSVVYSLASYASTRDLKRLHPAVLPVVGEIPVPKQLLPGGIAITRAVRALQQWRPDLGGFVDDNERLMYRGNTMDLLWSTLGVPLDKGRRARDAMERIHANRSKMRQFRRRYAVAAMNMDFGHMDSLRSRWAEEFPDFPALAMSHKDLARYRDNARIPMVARMLRTMGRGSSFLESNLYEVDRDLIAPSPGFESLVPSFAGVGR